MVEEALSAAVVEVITATRQLLFVEFLLLLS